MGSCPTVCTALSCVKDESITVYPYTPGNTEFGTKLGRQKTGRKSNLFSKSRFFEFTGTNAFSRIQNTGILEDTLPGVFRVIRISRMHGCIEK